MKETNQLGYPNLWIPLNRLDYQWWWLRFTSFLHLRPPKQVRDLRGPGRPHRHFQSAKIRFAHNWVPENEIFPPKLMQLLSPMPNKNPFRKHQKVKWNQSPFCNFCTFQDFPIMAISNALKCSLFVVEHPSPEPGSSTRSGHRTRCR